MTLLCNVFMHSSLLALFCLSIMCVVFIYVSLRHVGIHCGTLSLQLICHFGLSRELLPTSQQALTDTHNMTFAAVFCYLQPYIMCWIIVYHLHTYNDCSVLYNELCCCTVRDTENLTFSWNFLLCCVAAIDRWVVQHGLPARTGWNNVHCSCYFLLQKNKATPLHLAAKYGHIEIVRCLCAAGCNLEAVTEVREREGRGREGGREGGTEGGREEGRERGREGGRVRGEKSVLKCRKAVAHLSFSTIASCPSLVHAARLLC